MGSGAGATTAFAFNAFANAVTASLGIISARLCTVRLYSTSTSRLFRLTFVWHFMQKSSTELLCTEAMDALSKPLPAVLQNFKGNATYWTNVVDPSLPTREHTAK